jgi:hypothetical protein
VLPREYARGSLLPSRHNDNSSMHWISGCWNGPSTITDPEHPSAGRVSDSLLKRSYTQVLLVNIYTKARSVRHCQCPIHHVSGTRKSCGAATRWHRLRYIWRQRQQPLSFGERIRRNHYLLLIQAFRYSLLVLSAIDLLGALLFLLLGDGYKGWNDLIRRCSSSRGASERLLTPVRSRSN